MKKNNLNHNPIDTSFETHQMQKALDLAQIAFQENEVPVGAVVVNRLTKEVVGEGYNTCNKNKDPTLHAEMIAIKEACKNMNAKILSNCSIYVTLEPCPMCASAIAYSHISRLYYGAHDAKFGAVESNISIYRSTLSFGSPEIYSGVLSKQSESLLKNFFAQIRDK